MATDELNKATLQEALLSWFAREGRDFPWRQTTDPYAVLVAEKLLQQSIARPVLVRAYHQLLSNYPTPAALASAPVDEIRSIIRPLGFLYRAEELIALANVIVAEHGGAVPNTLEDLCALPGVGDYAARAVLSFAYGRDVPVVDTNIARFLYRLYKLPGPLPANPARKKSLLALAGSLVPAGKAREFNLAVIDLCAAVCKPSTPDCPECPLRSYCATGLERTKALDSGNGG